MADVVARRDRSWAARMAVAVAGCLLALAWLWAGRAWYPSDGTVVALDAGSVASGAVVVQAAVGPANSLRPGDVVIAVRRPSMSLRAGCG